jgi:hypothetical protein
MSPEDQKRDQILRFLYERHKTTRGIHKIPIGIRDLQAEMKSKHGMKPQEVSSNLDFLVQASWVCEVKKDRSITTKSGMELSQEQIKYKIHHTGITHMEAGTMFRKPESTSHINITNIQGVTVVGDGNIVNTGFTNLAKALDELDKAIGQSRELTDEQKLDAAGDLTTIRTQIAKKNPNRTVIAAAWESLKQVAPLATIASAAANVGQLIAKYLEQSQ